MKISEITDRSILVVAHPDDEVLWFSSVLEKVGKVVVCFLDVPSRPDWSQGRRESLRKYPRKDVISLGLMESEVFAGAAWPDPLPAEYGLVVKPSPGSMPGFSAERYKQNFELLRCRLRSELAGCRDVFTHNPWGEYGHEEHVQVFRAVDSIREELGFRLWFSNYFSNKSHGLMVRYMAEIDSGHFSLKTRPALGKRLQLLYSRNGCWTWYSDYEWPGTEVFIPWGGNLDVPPHAGTVIPMNAIRVEFRADAGTERSWRSMLGRVWRKARSAVLLSSSH